MFTDEQVKLAEAHDGPALVQDLDSVRKRIQSQAEIIDNGEEFILEEVGNKVMQDIDKVSELFDTVAVDFSCSVGKVGSTKMKLNIINQYLSCLEKSNKLFEWRQKWATAFKTFNDDSLLFNFCTRLRVAASVTRKASRKSA